MDGPRKCTLIFGDSIIWDIVSRKRRSGQVKCGLIGLGAAGSVFTISTGSTHDGEEGAKQTKRTSKRSGGTEWRGVLR